MKHNSLGAWILAGILALSSICKAQDFVIVNGTQKATIYVSNEVSSNSTEIFAAQELRDVIRQMTGDSISLSIVRTPGSGPQIVIGTDTSNALIAANSAALQLSTATNEEQIAVLRSGNNLFLAGKTPRAALYATYTFLQDVLGVRWLWPGASGEFIPKRSTVTVGNLSIFQAPLIEFRSLALTDAHPDSIPEVDTWMARNKMNVVSFREGDQATAIMQRRKQKGFMARIAGHNIVLPVATLQAHPDWAARLADGSRPISNTSQLCWGNTGVQNEVAVMIRQWLDDNPMVDIVHFYPADNQLYCTDGLCQNLGPDVSTRWQNFSKIILQKLDSTHPGKRFWTYAYQGYKNPPQQTAAPFEFVGYALDTVCYRHPYLSNTDPLSTNPLQQIQAWLNQNVKLGIRGYEYIMFTDPMFVPLVKWETEQMSWLASHGLNGYLSEIIPYKFPRETAPENTYWNCNRMNLYAAAKCMWSSISADSIVNDWNRTVYGGAYAPMRDYYRTIDTAWRNASGDIRKYNNAPATEVDKFLSIQKFAKLNNYFTIARTNVEQINDTASAPAVNEQIDLESKMLKNWQTIFNYKTERAYRYKTSVVHSSQISSAMWDTIPQLPAFEDNNGQPVNEQTDVKMAWTSTSLALRIVCHDNNVANRVQLAASHDTTQIPLDDCIELLIQKDPAKNEYVRLAVNSKSPTPYRYDASTKGGTLFARSWDLSPDWTASTTVNTTANTWTVDISIPLSALGIAGTAGTQFKMMIKRNRPGGTNSGWPDAAFYRQNSFASVTLVNEVANPLKDKIILYDQGNANRFPISVEFQKNGWQVSSGVDGESQLSQKLNEDAAVLLIKYSTTTGMNLSTAFFQNQIVPFISKGCVVILSGAHMPVNTWLPNLPNLAWLDSVASDRSTSWHLAGNWVNTPHDLLTIINNRLTPVTVYIPAAGWTSLAKVATTTRGDQPYLLYYQIGNGLLVVTSSALGYSGGFEMFGNSYLANTVQLVENLRAWQDAIHSYDASTQNITQAANLITQPSVTGQNEGLKVTGVENTVVHTGVFAAAAGTAVLTITDISGRTMAVRKLFVQKGGNTVPVPVSLVNGNIYVVSCNMNGKRYSVKFLK